MKRALAVLLAVATLESCSCTQKCGRSSPLTPSPLRTVVLKDTTDPHPLTLVFVAEGYLERELPDFALAVDALTTGLLTDVGGIVARAPDRFRFVRLDTPSASRALNNAARSDTAWGGCFSEDTLAHRWMLEVDEDEAVAAAARLEPGLSAVIVVFNTSQGTAQTISPAPGARLQVPVITLSTAEDAPLLTHELGHALVWLGDEYVRSSEAWPDAHAWFKAWAGDPFAEHANLAVGTSGAKWHDVLSGSLPGGLSFAKGLSHPTDDCRMLVSHSPSFCAVCSREVDRMLGQREAPSPPRVGVLLAEPPAAHRYALSARITAFDWDGLARISADVDGERCFSEFNLDAGTLSPGDFIGPEGAVRWVTPVSDPNPLSMGKHVLTVKAVDLRGEVTIVTVPFTRVPTGASRP